MYSPSESLHRPKNPRPFTRPSAPSTAPPQPQSPAEEVSSQHRPDTPPLSSSCILYSLLDQPRKKRESSSVFATRTSPIFKSPETRDSPPEHPIYSRASPPLVQSTTSQSPPCSSQTPRKQRHYVHPCFPNPVERVLRQTPCLSLSKRPVFCMCRILRLLSKSHPSLGSLKFSNAYCRVSANELLSQDLRTSLDDNAVLSHMVHV